MDEFGIFSKLGNYEITRNLGIGDFENMTFHILLNFSNNPPISPDEVKIYMTLNSPIENVGTITIEQLKYITINEIISKVYTSNSYIENEYLLRYERIG